MSMNALPAVRGLVPHLICHGADEAIEFYKSAFGAGEVCRVPGPDGKIMHASLSLNGFVFMLAEENLQYGNKAPTTLHGTPVRLHLRVDDVDAFMQRATAAGAKVIFPASDVFWGDRYGIVEDPFGHHWSMATPKVEMTEKEVEDAAKQFFHKS